MPASSRKRSLTCCALCGFGAKFHRRPGAVVLFGRLVTLNGRRRFACRVCLGGLKPAARLALIGRTPA